MPLAEDRSQAPLTFQVVGLDADRFQVVRFRGTEGLCQLYRFEIDLVSSDTSIALNDIVGKDAMLRVSTPDGPRWFHGVVSRFELADHTQDQLQFRAELVPSIWLLTHRYKSRIFQQKAVKDIISDVLTQAGFATDRFKFMFSRSYQPREYCVQYRETDYNFIARLMEEEGIWWCFEQSEDGHVLTMADDPAAYAPLPGDTQVPFVGASGMVSRDEHVFRFRLGQGVRPGAVVLNDYNFENPPLNLESRSNAGRDPGLEFSDYPGEYAEQSLGKDLAELRMQEFEASRIVGVGMSTSRRFAPARTFELIEHPVGALNAQYLLTSCTHQGKEATLRATTGTHGRTSVLDARVHQSVLAAQQSDNEQIRQLAEALLQVAARLRAGDGTAHRALTHWVYHAGQVSRDLANVAAATGSSPLEALALRNLIEDVAPSSVVDYDAPVYECRFECVPATVKYRPPRVTPWPVMRGSQTARVVGPAGEEIHTDKYGRVKVHFNWDRESAFDEHASCWIRVAQGLAGGQYGIMFLPRIGQEVIVDFLEGDPDQPIITGRVYNADNMPPYALPDEKTKSTIKSRSSTGGGGFNELRFEDKKDSEQIFMYGQKDLDIRILNDEKDWIGRDKHEIIKRNQKKTIEGAEGRAVGGDQAIKVGGSHCLQVKGDSAYAAKGKIAIGADGDLYLVGAKSGLYGDNYAEVNGATVHIEGNSITLKSGGSFVKVDGSGVTIVGGAVNINSGGAAGAAQSVAIANTMDPAGPLEAATGDPGKDFTYQRQPLPYDPIEDAPLHDEEASEQKHWIGIRLFDDNGQRLPGERYFVTMPDGTHVARGRTNDKGEAEIRGIDPGSCQVTFPDLDGATWEAGPAATSGARASAGGAASSPAGSAVPGGPALP